jgi:hypothetical protein
MPTPTTNGVALAAHEAIIQTASVNIQTLRVGKKQVTMGLFRQLPRDTLLDPETLQLRGVPWGHVHYWWDGDGSVTYSSLTRSAKLHVVWQLGEVLKRAVVYETPHGAPIDALECQHRARLEDWALLQVARAEHVVAVSSAACQIHLGKQVYRVTVSEPKAHVLTRYWGTHAKQGRGYSADMCAEAAANYAALLDERGLTGMTSAMVLASLAAAASERDAYKAKWAKQWQVLSALPQLFIAV